MTTCQTVERRPALMTMLGDEGLRLFFPLAALHAALWPFLWVVVHGFQLPFASALPPGLWHAHELIFGAYGAALIGFITTAIPEWSDTPRMRGRPLFVLAGLWAAGRIAGLTGADALAMVGGMADLLWLFALPLYVAAVSWRKRTTRLAAMIGWLTALALTGAAARVGFLASDADLARQGLHLAALVFLGLLGLVLARISVPVTNLVLDPSEETSPYRPHPGRRNLAPGLVALAAAGTLAGWSPAVTAYLTIAAGAAFLDRVAEGFIGREALRAEILALSGSSLLAGVGLLLVGAARLGAPFPETAALHVALMGGLGLGVMAVFAIAGLFHTGRALPLPRAARVAFVLLVLAGLARALPDLGALPALPGPPHALAATLWAGAFLVWLKAYWPFLSTPRVPDGGGC